MPDAREKYQRNGDAKKDNQYSFSARYPLSEELINVVPDIPRIFLDLHERQDLGVTDLDSIKVRRDLLDLFLKEAREFGMIMFISLFAIYQIFPFDQLSKYLDLTQGIVKVGVVLTSFFGSMTVTLLNIRSKCR